jgi:hypothetical protein
MQNGRIGWAYRCLNEWKPHHKLQFLSQSALPKCQGNKREDWIQARMTELLPVPYFHVVLPCQLVLILWLHQPKMYDDTLFEATWETLQQFGKTRKYKWE